MHSHQTLVYFHTYANSPEHLASFVPGPVLAQKLAMAHIWFECVSQTFVCWKCAFHKLVMLL